MFSKIKYILAIMSLALFSPLNACDDWDDDYFPWDDTEESCEWDPLSKEFKNAQLMKTLSHGKMEIFYLGKMQAYIDIEKMIFAETFDWFECHLNEDRYKLIVALDEYIKERMKSL